MAETKGRVEVLETSLQDGTLGEGVEFSLDDKLACLQEFVKMGFDFVEAGFALPPTLGKLTCSADRELFKQVSGWNADDLGDTKVVAYGLLPSQDGDPMNDPGLLALLSVGMEWVSVVGRASRPYLEQVLNWSDPSKYPALVEKSVRLLTREGKQVLFLAEQFFNAYAEDPAFALAVLQAARAGGACRLVLADTRGGALPHEVGATVTAVREALEREEGQAVPLGFHGHNDGGVAVANTLAAVLAGASHVQGTVNGVGERCGNTDLVAVLANLKLKLGCDVLKPDSLPKLAELSRFMYQKVNRNYMRNQPYVGEQAFAHKGGMVMTALRKQPPYYEHVAPEAVGNRRRLLVGDLSDLDLLKGKLEAFRLELDGEKLVALLRQLEALQRNGWQFDDADASFYLLVLKHLGRYRAWFEPQHYCVLARGSAQKPEGKTTALLADTQAEASVKLKVNGEVRHAIREGNGPVNALDLALREALRPSYPQLDDMYLTEYAVCVTDGKVGTAAPVRVKLRTWDQYHQQSWGAVAVSDDIVAASWLALVDALEFKRLLDAKEIWTPTGA